MKKNLIRLTTIGAVAALAIVATGAFFSDTETSTGNAFVAGAIDLKVDNTSYVTSTVSGELVESPNTSWELSDLNGHLFFDFHDLKPGDIGEDTISLHVNDNDAWLCAAARITDDSDQSCTEPELEDDLTCTDPGLGQGELDDELNFAFWADDGDNVYEQEERIFLQGPISGIGAAGQIALADSQTNIWGGQGPFPGGQTKYIGKAWCFGELTQAPVAPGEGGPLSGGAQARGTGFTCNGELVNNAAQTDQVKGDLQFYAVQSRNNSGFTCSENYQPDWPDIVERPIVGALLSAYTQPTTCDVTVDDNGANPALDTIQEGVNAASAGQTVCVEDGTYVEDVNVNKSLTLSGDGATATSTINGVGTGEAGALVISADNVIVEGFNVIGTGVSAIRIQGAHDNVTIRYNKAVAATGKNALLMNGGQSNHTISHNVFEGSASQLVYVNGFASVATASTNVDFVNNTFGGSATGPLLGMEANSSLVSMNKFSGTTPFTSLEAWESDLLVNENNFNVVGQIHVTNSVVGTLNAENNWWGDGDPSNNIGGGVDFTPFEVSAFPEN